MQNLPPSQKLLLLSLADGADEHHFCCPSFKRLANDTGLDERAINVALDKMHETGIISRTNNGIGLSMK
jgi:predicted transcriptional regulator